MSRDLGADERIVSVVQYLRVILTVSTLPLVTAVVFHPAQVSVSVPTPDGPGWIAGLLFTGVCAAAGILIAWRLRVPAGTLLTPLVIAAALSVTGWAQGATTPDWLAQTAYAVIGLSIGLGFTRNSLRMIRRVLPMALILTVAVIVGCAGLGLFLSSVTGLSSLTGYLATSPGGLFAVLAIAVDTGSDPTFVLAVQVLRIFIMLLISPLLAVVLARRRSP
jgi:membrane AbrB-like protein